ncbi:MAG: DCC1-like thiol-disulfide oxidoreductase family protein [Ignavibacteriales bacterium]|nr:DCC1-like thiol-disulfide oxidoreductase family protein [Ignavibacteriales bacterium]
MNLLIGIAEQDKNPIIIYDGVCNLCNFWIKFISKRDSKELFRYSQFQSEYSRRLIQQYKIDTDLPSSVILIVSDKIFLRSSAVIEIFQLLKFPYSILGIFKYIPRKIRDLFYDLISNHRYKWFGRSTHCVIPNEGIKSHLIENPTE